ncbi:putative autophagy-related protein 11 [Prorops nasuta]|uniref:putative autophagy-related protein 11 n=1 Tax=Prorops nasuta TaxID=863751 RepID=UPI0034CFECCA
MILSFFKNFIIELTAFSACALLYFEGLLPATSLLQIFVDKSIPLVLTFYSWYSTVCFYMQLKALEKNRSSKFVEADQSAKLLGLFDSGDSSLEGIERERLASFTSLDEFFQHLPYIDDDHVFSRSLATILTNFSQDSDDCDSFVLSIVENPSLTPAEKAMKLLGLSKSDIIQAQLETLTKSSLNGYKMEESTTEDGSTEEGSLKDGRNGSMEENGEGVDKIGDKVLEEGIEGDKKEENGMEKIEMEEMKEESNAKEKNVDTNVEVLEKKEEENVVTEKRKKSIDKSVKEQESMGETDSVCKELIFSNKMQCWAKRGTGSAPRQSPCLVSRCSHLKRNASVEENNGEWDKGNGTAAKEKLKRKIHSCQEYFLKMNESLSLKETESDPSQSSCSPSTCSNLKTNICVGGILVETDKKNERIDKSRLGIVGDKKETIEKKEKNIEVIAIEESKRKAYPCDKYILKVKECLMQKETGNNVCRSSCSSSPYSKIKTNHGVNENLAEFNKKNEITDVNKLGKLRNDKNRDKIAKNATGSSCTPSTCSELKNNVNVGEHFLEINKKNGRVDVNKVGKAGNEKEMLEKKARNIEHIPKQKDKHMKPEMKDNSIKENRYPCDDYIVNVKMECLITKETGSPPHRHPCLSNQLAKSETPKVPLKQETCFRKVGREYCDYLDRKELLSLPRRFPLPNCLPLQSCKTSGCCCSSKIQSGDSKKQKTTVVERRNNLSDGGERVGQQERGEATGNENTTERGEAEKTGKNSTLTINKQSNSSNSTEKHTKDSSETSEKELKTTVTEYSEERASKEVENILLANIAGASEKNPSQDLEKKPVVESSENVEHEIVGSEMNSTNNENGKNMEHEKKNSEEYLNMDRKQSSGNIEDVSESSLKISEVTYDAMSELELQTKLEEQLSDIVDSNKLQVNPTVYNSYLLTYEPIVLDSRVKGNLRANMSYPCDGYATSELVSEKSMKLPGMEEDCILQSKFNGSDVVKPNEIVRMVKRNFHTSVKRHNSSKMGINNLLGMDENSQETLNGRNKSSDKSRIRKAFDDRPEGANNVIPTNFERSSYSSRYLQSIKNKNYLESLKSQVQRKDLDNRRGHEVDRPKKGLLETVENETFNGNLAKSPVSSWRLLPQKRPLYSSQTKEMQLSAKTSNSSRTSMENSVEFPNHPETLSKNDSPRTSRLSEKFRLAVNKLKPKKSSKTNSQESIEKPVKQSGTTKKTLLSHKKSINESHSEAKNLENIFVDSTLHDEIKELETEMDNEDQEELKMLKDLLNMNRNDASLLSKLLNKTNEYSDEQGTENSSDSNNLENVSRRAERYGKMDLIEELHNVNEDIYLEEWNVNINNEDHRLTAMNHVHKQEHRPINAPLDISEIVRNIRWSLHPDGYVITNKNLQIGSLSLDNLQEIHRRSIVDADMVIKLHKAFYFSPCIAETILRSNNDRDRHENETGGDTAPTATTNSEGNYSSVCSTVALDELLEQSDSDIAALLENAILTLPTITDSFSTGSGSSSDADNVGSIQIFINEEHSGEWRQENRHTININEMVIEVNPRNVPDVEKISANHEYEENNEDQERANTELARSNAIASTDQSDFLSLTILTFWKIITLYYVSLIITKILSLFVSRNSISPEITEIRSVTTSISNLPKPSSVNKTMDNFVKDSADLMKNYAAEILDDVLENVCTTTSNSLSVIPSETHMDSYDSTYSNSSNEELTVSCRSSLMEEFSDIGSLKSADSNAS